MTREQFDAMLDRLHAAGLAQDDIDWSENVGPPADAQQFAAEAIYVICNSGMKNTVARKIYDKVMPMVHAGGSARNVFGHRGKSDAIDVIWIRRQSYFDGYILASDKVEYCATLPWIGAITKYHLAKNFGADVAKPDVHMQRLADIYGVTPQGLCEQLATQTGYRIATIDLLIWRACAVGILDSRTGQLRAA